MVQDNSPRRVSNVTAADDIITLIFAMIGI